MKKNKTDRKQKEVKDMVVVDGTVVEAFANAMFDVKLDNGLFYTLVYPLFTS